MKFASFCAAAALLGPLASLAAQTPAPKPSRTIDFTGQILINGFYNNARVNNSDVPQFALADTNPVSGGGGTLRQTRLGLLVTEPDVLGGMGSAEVDVDFFGGQPAAGGRTFPVLRLRRALATVSWSKTEMLLGQEAPLVAGRDPRTLASVGIPGFAGAGNLWLWIPQARLGFETGVTLRLGLQGAVLAPTTNGNSGAFLTQPDSAERTGRPFLQGRLKLGWGPTDDPSEIAFGGHIGWIRGFDATTQDSIVQSSAFTVDARFALGEIEILGEAFMGQALGVLGGGGVGQSVGLNGVPVRTVGGWGQLNLKLRRTITVGGGCGIDDPDDVDLLAAGARQNFVCAGNLEWRSGPLAFGLELRRLETEYTNGDFTATHVNVAAAWKF
jgi:hypothetical protein